MTKTSSILPNLESQIILAIQQAVATAAQEELNAAKIRLDGRLPEILAAIAIKLGEYVAFDRYANNLTIHVKYENK